MTVKMLVSTLVISVMLVGACVAPPASPSPTEIPISPSPTETPTPTQPQPTNVPTQTLPTPSGEQGLPWPIITGNSVEICLNSRYSEHTLTGNASTQQIASVLWAAGKAPLTGSYRNIYVSTPTSEYLYDPDAHILSWYSSQPVTDSAFTINCDSDLTFDTGVTYMLAMLESVSLWKSSEPAVASCPKQTSLCFGVQGVRGLTSELVAHSSVPQGDPGWLPDPSTDGQDKIEEVLANLNYFSGFSSKNLTLQEVSQLLWAGYGCTPHTANIGGRQGLTVPSAFAEYYLTGTIYLANENGVYRYQNRNPSTDLTTTDHRLELVKSNDVRGILGSAVSGLPQAPCYIIICLDYSRVSGAQEQTWAVLETGFVAANILVQATAIGLGCNFESTLTTQEQASIQVATGIPSSHTPQVVISIGGMPE